MKFSRKPLFAAVPAALIAGSMLAAPVASAQSSLPTGSLGDIPGLGSLGPADPNACSAVSNPDNAGGWVAGEGDTAAKYTDESVKDADGSLDLSRAAASDDNVSFVKSIAPVKVEAATNMSFEIKTTTEWESGMTGLNPNYILVVDLDGDGESTATTTLGWEPLYNGTAKDEGGNPGEWAYPEGTALKPTADGENGRWIALTEDIAGPSEGVDGYDQYWPTFSLTEFQAKFPEAKVTAYGVMNEKGANPADMYADNVGFGDCTTNFQAAAGPDFGSLALGGGLALAAALAAGGGAWAVQNGMIQLPPELAAMLPQ